MKIKNQKVLNELKKNKKDFPLILTTSRVLQHYNAATMTRRTKNIKIADEDILLIHPKDVKTWLQSKIIWLWRSVSWNCRCVVPFFKGVSRERLGNLGLQWPVQEDGKDTKILHEKEFKLGKGRIKYFDWKESSKIEKNKKDYPLILTTSRVLQHYNASTMTRRTKNINIVDEDVLLVHPKDAKYRELNTGDVARLYSGRGEVSLKVEVTDKVKEGIVFTTFHFPEHMVNMVTGHGKDEETMCAEYKVSFVEVQKISNKFKTEVVVEKKQAEVTST